MTYDVETYCDSCDTVKLCCLVNYGDSFAYCQECNNAVPDTDFGNMLFVLTSENHALHETACCYPDFEYDGTPEPMLFTADETQQDDEWWLMTELRNYFDSPVTAA